MLSPTSFTMYIDKLLTLYVNHGPILSKTIEITKYLILHREHDTKCFRLTGCVQSSRWSDSSIITNNIHFCNLQFWHRVHIHVCQKIISRLCISFMSSNFLHLLYYKVRHIFKTIYCVFMSQNIDYFIK